MISYRLACFYWSCYILTTRFGEKNVRFSVAGRNCGSFVLTRCLKTTTTEKSWLCVYRNAIYLNGKAFKVFITFPWVISVMVLHSAEWRSFKGRYLYARSRYQPYFIDAAVIKTSTSIIYNDWTSNESSNLVYTSAKRNLGFIRISRNARINEFYLLGTYILTWSRGNGYFRWFLQRNTRMWIELKFLQPLNEAHSGNRQLVFWCWASFVPFAKDGNRNPQDPLHTGLVSPWRLPKISGRYQ